MADGITPAGGGQVRRPLRGEASTKFMLVHNSDYYVETCLISANLYGKMSYLVLSSTILLGASAPP
jgi:hypothetical protein